MKDTIIRIWKKWFGFKTGQVTNITSKEPTSQPSVTKKETRLPSPMLQKLEDYLFETYNFRFNVLTEQTGYAPKGSAEYQQADQRVMNTLCIEARTQGINCWDKDISRLLLSQKIADFHPFQHYMTHLPEWDGTD